MTAHPRLDVETARRYAEGEVTSAESLTVEQAMDASAEWRALVGSQVDSGRLDLNLADVLAEIDAPRRGVIERLMVRLGLSEYVARLMAATPVLRRSWYLATVLVLFFGIAAANPDRGDASLGIFLALAPLVPVLGVGVAYGPGVDPAHEMTVATPLSGFRLLLLRSVAVLATSVVFGGVASIIIAGQQGPRVVAWMLPALTLTVLTLVVATVVPTRVAAAITAGGWLLAVSIATSASDSMAMFGGFAQASYLAIAAVAGAILVFRRSTFEAMEVRP